ncbi:MAG: hypothetical protein RR539_07825 [Clostridium sp.]|uniref:hypothetical protein n=1 Tax=Clostridium sp. TaxID=1506 RepID=UPI002FCB6895
MELKDRYVKFLGISGVVLSLMVVIGGFCFRAKIDNNMITDPNTVTSILKYEKIKNNYILSEYAPFIYDCNMFNKDREVILQGNFMVKEVIGESGICYKVMKNGDKVFETSNNFHLNKSDIELGRDKIGFSTTRSGSVFMYLLNFSEAETILKLVGISKDGSTNTKTIIGENIIADLTESDRVKIRIKNGIVANRDKVVNGTMYFTLDGAGIIIDEG